MRRPFKPPIKSLFSPWIRLIFPLFLRFGKSRVQVTVTSQCREILEQMRNQRCMLVPNHPSQSEPLVMFELGRQLRQHFLFVVAWQVFERLNGFQGWLLQRVGSYSLIRGIADRESFRYTRSALQNGKMPLVVFAEGFATNHNAQIFPIETGTIGLGFMALQDFQKRFPENTLPPLYLVPVGIQYHYDDSIRKELLKSVTRLESALGFEILSQGKSITLEKRLMRVGEYVIRRMAAEYGISFPENHPLDALSLAELQDILLAKIEQLFSLPAAPDLSVWSRIKRIHGVKDHNLFEQALVRGTYERTWLKRKSVLAELFFHQLLTLHGALIEENPTLQRMVEITRRLEKEILGSATCQGPRKAVIKAAPPINLSEHYEAYRRERKLTLLQITQQVQQALQNMVDPSGSDLVLCDDIPVAEVTIRANMAQPS
jgi:1-acyl-sn-glycerol-3-phosphate acyltransferase